VGGLGLGVAVEAGVTVGGIGVIEAVGVGGSGDDVWVGTGVSVGRIGVDVSVGSAVGVSVRVEVDVGLAVSVVVGEGEAVLPAERVGAGEEGVGGCRSSPTQPPIRRATNVNPSQSRSQSRLCISTADPIPLPTRIRYSR
jgi:hypothetical protein